MVLSTLWCVLSLPAQCRGSHKVKALTAHHSGQGPRPLCVTRRKQSYRHNLEHGCLLLGNPWLGDVNILAASAALVQRCCKNIQIEKLSCRRRPCMAVFEGTLAHNYQLRGVFRLFPSAISAARLNIGALETPMCGNPLSGSRNGADILDRKIGT